MSQEMKGMEAYKSGGRTFARATFRLIHEKKISSLRDLRPLIGALLPLVG
jgi:hypothetical protein